MSLFILFRTTSISSFVIFSGHSRNVACRDYNATIRELNLWIISINLASQPEAASGTVCAAIKRRAI